MAEALLVWITGIIVWFFAIYGALSMGYGC